MASSSGKSFITALFLMVLTFSCTIMSSSVAESRRLLQITQPSIPNMPAIPSNLPKPTGFPPLPSIPTTIPQPKINIPPLPTNLPNLPKPSTTLPPLPTVPQATIPPLPKIPSIPTIPFFSPPPSN